MKDPEPEPWSQMTPEFLTHKRDEKKMCFLLFQVILFWADVLPSHGGLIRLPRQADEPAPFLPKPLVSGEKMTKHRQQNDLPRVFVPICLWA